MLINHLKTGNEIVVLFFKPKKTFQKYLLLQMRLSFSEFLFSVITMQGYPASQIKVCYIKGAYRIKIRLCGLHDERGCVTSFSGVNFLKLSHVF